MQKSNNWQHNTHDVTYQLKRIKKATFLIDFLHSNSLRAAPTSSPPITINTVLSKFIVKASTQSLGTGPMPFESRLQRRHIPDPEPITPVRLEAAYWSSLGKRL